MESRNRSNGRRTGADTELEPSEEFPILYGLLTAPKSYKPKSREQMRDWHKDKPVSIEADSSLDLEDDYDSSPNNSCNDDSPSPTDENDMSLIFNYIGARGRYHEGAGADEDDEDFASDSDDNSPSSTTSFRKKSSDLSRRQFCYGGRVRRRTGGRVGSVSNQREKISSRGDMPLLEAMIMASPKVSTTSDFEIRKLSDVIGLDSSSPSRSPTRRIVTKSELNLNSPPNLVPSVNLNVNVKVQSSSHISNSDRSASPLLAAGTNEVIICGNRNVYIEQPNEELHRLRSKRENVGEDLSVCRLSSNKSRLENSQNQRHTNNDLASVSLLGKQNRNVSHFPITVPKKRPYNRRADDLHPHLAKALRLGSGLGDPSFNLQDKDKALKLGSGFGDPSFNLQDKDKALKLGSGFGDPSFNLQDKDKALKLGNGLDNPGFNLQDKDKSLKLGNGLDNPCCNFQDNGRPYKCSECDLSFKTATLLSRHMHTHLRDQLFQCELCSSTFRRRDNLLAHMRTSCKGKRFLEAQQLDRRTMLAQSSKPTHVQNHLINKKVSTPGNPSNHLPIKMSLADFMNNTIKERNQSSSIHPGVSSSSASFISQLKDREQLPKLPFGLEIEEVVEADDSTPTSTNLPGFPLKQIFNRDYPPQLNRQHDFLKSISSSGSSPVEKNNVPTMRKLLGSASLAIKRPTAVVQPAIYVRESKSVEVIDVDDDEEEEEKPPPKSNLGLEAFPCGHCNGVFRDLDRLLKHTKTHMKGKSFERIEVVIE